MFQLSVIPTVRQLHAALLVWFCLPFMPGYHWQLKISFGCLMGVSPPPGACLLHPRYSFFVTRNWRLILLSTILLFLKSVKHTLIFSQILRIPNLHWFFTSSSGCRVIINVVIIHSNEICKTYLGTVLPPSSRNWQLIYLCSVCSKH